ncbi:Argininosuccinate synthase [Candidatus Annandia adelgestsuga]|uniref:Argininosuccinate synthase n=1 Tax=Candidatus Annandia adelgestsuga TaxID=1302411 RepID=A0A3S9J7W8_9ENTR|nr:argininosuccinate synthase [Candidatus Annandia adelgestsuga]AZP36415.1 Argininosuccinate synthase [Candidatus Annandia adelgestsuga]
MNKKIKKVILAYSGGLDTSAIIPWLKENYNCKVIALVVDIGQSYKDLKNIKKKALKSGANSCYILNLKKKFIKNYLYPLLHNKAIYENNYLLGTAIARPLIAKAQIDLALKLKADTLSHGATGKGNDQIRFEYTYASLAPKLNVIAPWRKWNFNSREDIIKYLKKKKIHTTASLKKIYSQDENIWHISTEGGNLEKISNPSNKNCWSWTLDIKDTPNKPDIISLQIKNGYIISINNNILNPIKCLLKLNLIGKKHGIGRIDIVENRIIGMKSRGCYETPGGTIIAKVLDTIEQLVFDKETIKWRSIIGIEMSHLIYDGKWFTPMRKSLQSANKPLLKLLTGEVKIKLYKGNITILQRKSPYSLYSQKTVTFNKDKSYNHNHSAGFIRLFSLSSRIRSLKYIK